MGSIDKLVQKMRDAPHGIRVAEIDRVLQAKGFELRSIRGSHHYYAKGGQTISVPARKPHVLAAYVRLVLRMIEELE